MGTYNDTKDPLEHLETFKGLMNLYAYIDVIKCKALQLTLTNKAKS